MTERELPNLPDLPTWQRPGTDRGANCMPHLDPGALMATALVAAAAVARDRPYQPSTAATPDEVDFVTDCLMPLERIIAGDDLQPLLATIQTFKHRLMAREATPVDWLQLLRHVGAARDMLTPLLRTTYVRCEGLRPPLAASPVEPTEGAGGQGD